MSSENNRPTLEHTKTIRLKRGRLMRRKELKNLLVLLEDIVGEGGYVQILLTTATRTIQRKVTSDEIDSYLDELTRGEVVNLLILSAWGGGGPLRNHIELSLSSLYPEIKVSGADRSWVFGRAETIRENLARWDRPSIDLALLLRMGWWPFGLGMLGMVVTGLLAKLGMLHLDDPLPVLIGVCLVIWMPPLLLEGALLRFRTDLLRPIRIDFYVPKDEERERAQNWAERREKLAWLAIGIVFTVVAELIAYGLLKKLGLL